MSIVYQAGVGSGQNRYGLSGAPVRRVGLSSRSEVVYVDANGDVVLSDGSLFNGSYRDDSNAQWYLTTDGKTRIVDQFLGGGAVGSTNTGGTTSNKKCCNCVTSDVNENWFLTATKRTAQDVPVSITRRKTVCQDPNSQVKINCNQLKSAAGLQGLGSLGCGCDAKM